MGDLARRFRVFLRVRALAPAAFALAAAMFAGLALCRHCVVRPFGNPIAFAFSGDALFVFDKADDALLELRDFAPGRPLTLASRRRIEEDDARHYYMVRKLYPGPRGLVVHSYLYRHDTHRFAGYRFREYRSFDEPPRDLLTIMLDDNTFPEIKYAFDAQGRHYFANDIRGQIAIGRIPPEGGVVVDHALPPTITRFGETNPPLCCWESIAVAASGNFFLASGAAGNIREYAPDGALIRTFGKVGFEPGQLLAPKDITFTPLEPGAAPDVLTVASTGNRTWTRFDGTGRLIDTIEPLKSGYPFKDILVGPLLDVGPGGRLASFDLVNKAMVFPGTETGVATEYREHRTLRLLKLAALSGLCLLFALASWVLGPRLRRLRFPFFMKLALLFIPILCLTAYMVGYVVKDAFQEDLKEEHRRRSANLASAIIKSVPVSDLEAIQAPEDRESQVYQRVYNTVSRLVDVQGVAGTPKWILHKIRDGRYYFGINIWRGPIYEPFIVPRDRPMFFNALETARPQSGRFTDTQGEWFSYLAPIADAQGKIINVLELYKPTEALDRTESKAEHGMAATIAGFLLLSVGLAFICSYVFSRPLNALTQATALISKGNFDHVIRVRTHDEIRDLADAFNRMSAELKAYMVNLARTTADRERISAELKFASEVQKALLPKVFPPFPRAANVELFGRMDPAREVGGDYFDFFLIDEHHMGVAIADVSGKGVPAGLLMMRVHTMLRSGAHYSLGAADSLARINREIAQTNPAMMFVTMVYFICDLRDGSIRLCNAGHPAPLLLRRSGAEWLPIARSEPATNMALGVLETAAYDEQALKLLPGESLLLYTDGFTECVDKGAAMFGESRLLDCVAADPERSNRERCETLFARIAAHQAGLEPFDDATALFFKYLSLPAPRAGPL